MNSIALKKINLVVRLAVLATLVLIAYAPSLWFGNNSFPAIARFDFLPVLNQFWNYLFTILFISLLVIYLIKPIKYIGFSIVLLYVFLALIDQNRLQPYFYQSILSIFIVSLLNKDKLNAKLIMHGLMFVFIATYFWSGVQKIDPNFNYIWSLAFAKHFGFLPESVRYLIIRLIPYAEASVGLFLVFNLTRKLGVIGVVFMHTGITIMLLYLGYGYNVIPWNLQNIISVIILFLFYKSNYNFDIFLYHFNYKKGIILVFTFLLPLTNFFGFWDNLLSYSFFSAKLKYYYVELNKEKLLPKLPKDIAYYVFEFEGKKIIDLNDWAGTENGVLLYPEDRVVKKTVDYLKNFADNPKDKDVLIVHEYHQNKEE